MKLVFLNNRSFQSKKGKMCHMITFADEGGNVMEFFHDGTLDVGNIRPFVPVDVVFSYESYGNGVRTKVACVTIERKE